MTAPTGALTQSRCVESSALPSEQIQTDRRRQRRTLVALLAAGIATFAELYAPQGVLTEIARSLHVTAASASLTVSAATIGLACGVLIWAWIADLIGRLTAMRIAVSTAAVLSALSCLAPDLPILLAVRFLDGMVLGAVPVLAVAYVYDIFSGPRAAVSATAYIAGTTIGGAAGRLIAGPLAPTIGWRWAILVVCGVCLVAALCFIALAPSPTVARHETREPQLPRIRAALRVARLRRLYLQALLMTGCFVAVYNFLAFRLEAPPFSLAAALASLLFVAYGAGTVSSRSAGRLIPRIGPENTILAGLAAMFIGLVLLDIDTLPTVLVGLVIFTGGFFCAHATAATTAGTASQESFRAQASALYNIGFYVGSGVGGWLLGIVFVHAGWTVMTVTIAVDEAVVAAVIVQGARAPSRNLSICAPTPSQGEPR